MNEHDGTLDFDYKGKRMIIPYSYSEYGGNPHIHLTDKYGYCHVYTYRERYKEWVAIGKERRWHADFVYSLHRMFDTVMEKAKSQ